MQMKKSNWFKKKEKSCLIIFNKPHARYVDVLTDIPFEFIIGKKYKYIYTIINHFSKLSNSFLLENKIKRSDIIIIRKFFQILCCSEQFGCD